MITTTTIPVRYPDLDPMAIVHHAVYPIWYEIARMDILGAAGFPWEKMHELGIDPVMVNLNLDYAAPVRYPADVTVKTKLIQVESKKLKILYECYDGEKLVNRATSFHIWTKRGQKGMSDLTSIHLGEHLPEIYDKLQAACETE